MKVGMKYWQSGIAVVLVGMTLIMSAPMVFADSINSNVLDINARVGGLTYGQWSAKWWQRAFSLPDNFTDCTENQPTGPVWFLDGTSAVGPSPVTRECTIPAGKNIMFPIFNSEQSVVEARSSNTGNLQGSTCALRDIKGKLIKGTGYAPLLACAQAFAQHALDSDATLEADIDGTVLKNPTHYRAATPPPPFSFTAVPNNPFASIICTANAANGCPLTSKSVADGYWIILQNPLSAGQHTIHFKADIPFFAFTTEVTYILTVQ